MPSTEEHAINHDGVYWGSYSGLTCMACSSVIETFWVFIRICPRTTDPQPKPHEVADLRVDTSATGGCQLSTGLPRVMDHFLGGSDPWDPAGYTVHPGKFHIYHKMYIDIYIYIYLHTRMFTHKYIHA